MNIFQKSFFLSFLFGCLMGSTVIFAASAAKDPSESFEIPEIYDEAFKVLGLPSNATREEIAKAYHRLALNFHPDKHSDKSKQEQVSLEEKFIQIKKAHDLLMEFLSKAQVQKEYESSAEEKEKKRSEKEEKRRMLEEENKRAWDEYRRRMGESDEIKKKVEQEKKQKKIEHHLQTIENMSSQFEFLIRNKMLCEARFCIFALERYMIDRPWTFTRDESVAIRSTWEVTIKKLFQMYASFDTQCEVWTANLNNSAGRTDLYPNREKEQSKLVYDRLDSIRDACIAYKTRNAARIFMGTAAAGLMIPVLLGGYSKICTMGSYMTLALTGLAVVGSPSWYRTCCLSGQNRSSMGGAFFLGGLVGASLCFRQNMNIGQVAGIIAASVISGGVVAAVGKVINRFTNNALPYASFTAREVREMPLIQNYSRQLMSRYNDIDRILTAS